MSEALLDAASISRFRAGYVAAFGAVVQDLGLLGQRLVGHGASFIARMSLPVASVSRA